MADDLVDEWSKLKLTEEEKIVFGENFEDVSDSYLKDQISLSLVGKLLTVKPFNVEAMKRTLLSIRRLRENVVVRMVESNLFVFQFFSEQDKDRVLEGCQNRTSRFVC